jgi:hypothetical protein
MSSRHNLADPTREPTDEELTELSHEAFAGVHEKRLAVESDTRRRIAERRAALREARAARAARRSEAP